MNIQHKLITAVALSLLPLSLHAQSEHQAFRLLAPADPQGSARYSALSGAMGAVGSDISSLARNPAGISLFRGANRATLTLQLAGQGTDASWYGLHTSTTDRAKVRLGEFGYQIGTNRASRGRLSFAFAIREAARYDRTMNASATPPTSAGGYSSLADYAAARTNGARYDLGRGTEVDRKFSLAYLQDPSRSANDPDLPFISIFGAGAGWIAPASGSRRFQSLYSAPVSATSLMLRERGSITEYDFALGAELTDALHVGVIGTLSSLDYSLDTYYEELHGQEGRLSLQNVRTSSGFGAKLGLGVLYEPLDGLRLGASLYTPTYYSMNEDFRALAQGQRRDFSDGRASLDYSPTQSYRLRGAWRFGLSGAYLLGQLGFLSVDYDYTTLGNLRLSNTTGGDGDYLSFGSDEAGFEGDNAQLKYNYQGVHTVRVGLEALLTQRLALRAGFRYSTSPLKNDGLKGATPTTEVLVPGPTVQYTLPDANQSYSVGAGWRITPGISLDLAYVYGRQQARTFAFPYVNDYGNSLDASSAQLPEARDGLLSIAETTTRHKAVATLSFRF